MVHPTNGTKTTRGRRNVCPWGDSRRKTELLTPLDTIFLVSDRRRTHVTSLLYGVSWRHRR